MTAEMWRKCAQYGNRRRLIVDEHAAFATGGYLAPQDELRFARVDAVRLQHFVERFRLDFKHRRDDGLFRAVAHRVRRGFVAQQQCECIDQNGFSSAGFAGQEVEPGGELHGDVVDDRVVFYPQFQQHSEFSLA